jgi:tetratricopeptide (TPR) repeat protein
MKMADRVHRIRSELPSGDPALLNRVAWSRRWTDRMISVDHADNARKTALAGTGKRSRVQQGLALRTLAWHARWRGELDKAMGHCLNAETFLPEREHAEARAVLYAILGSIHFARNRFDLANCSVDRGFWLMRDTPEAEVAEVMTELLLTRATIQHHTGERARAGITLGRAQELATSETSPCINYCTASWLLSDRDSGAALARAEPALASAREFGNRLIQPYLMALVGTSSAELGRPDAAIALFEEALKIADEDGDRRARTHVLRDFARLDLMRGDEATALQRLIEAATIAKQQDHAFERKRLALLLAEVYERMGKYRQAVDQHKLAWRLQNDTRTR